jgi:DNA-binding IclR family transcriptional regulator
MDDHTVAGRVVAILEVAAAEASPAPLARLTAGTGIPKPTVRRIANRLVEHGILRRVPEGYVLGLRLAELGMMAVRQLGNAEFMAPYVHELHRRTGQIAWVGAVNGDSLVVLDAAYGQVHAKLMDPSIWTRMTPEADATTAAGHLMLAARPEATERVLRSGLTRLTPYTVVSPRLLQSRWRRTAETGLALEQEETCLGWWCAAVLLPGPTAPHIVGLTAETHGLSPARALPQLRRIAEGLGRELKGIGVEHALPE